MKFNLYLLTKTWFNCYENAPAPEGDNNNTPPEGTGNNNNPPVNNPADDDKPTLSQKQLNKILAEEKRKHQTVIQKQVNELEQLKKSKGLTEKEKTDLQNRIEELQNSLLSKEQLSEKEKKKLAEEHKKQIESMSGERDQWRGLFQKSTIQRSILDAATKADAFSPSQIVALLENNTRLVEVLDQEGTPVPGEFQAKTRFRDVDGEGKPVTLELTVEEAILRMKDRVNEYGNLFKSHLSGGVGGSPTKPGKTDVDPSKMSPEEYRKWRNKRLGRKEQA